MLSYLFVFDSRVFDIFKVMTCMKVYYTMLHFKYFMKKVTKELPACLLPRDSSSGSCKSCQRLDRHWVDTFMKPWERFPEQLMQPLEKGR